MDEVTEMYGDRECRWYQIEARNRVEMALMAKKKRILVVAPTGSGKTLTSGLIFTSQKVKDALGVKGRNLRLLFVAHKARLLSQAEDDFANAQGVDFIMQSAFSPVPEGVEWDIVCIDEAHHEAMMTIQYQLDVYGQTPIIGLTATPDRADGHLIKFEEIIEPISRVQAVDEGWLAETELNTIVDSPDKNKVPITKNIIDNFGDRFGQTMMFFRTKAEVREIRDYLQGKGYRAIAILDQKDQEVNEILNSFSQGEIQFILNCNKINEGVDVVGCTDVYLGRQFGSYPQLNQVIGRAARPDSECRVWELVNPIHGKNLDTTVVVGTPASHRLFSKRANVWKEQLFNYTTH